jgi:hypothetical protein
VDLHQVGASSKQTLVEVELGILLVETCIMNTSKNRHYVIVPYVTIPNVTIPKLVKIPNINRNPAIPPKLFTLLFTLLA